MTGPLITYSAKIHDHEKYDDTLDLFAGTYTPNTPVKADITVAISDSLGFGGHNGCIAFRKYVK